MPKVLEREFLCVPIVGHLDGCFAQPPASGSRGVFEPAFQKLLRVAVSI